MTHPAYAELVDRFRYARQLWRSSQGVQEIAASLGMSEWEYCLQVVGNMGPILWTGTTTSQMPELSAFAWQAFVAAAADRDGGETT